MRLAFRSSRSVASVLLVLVLCAPPSRAAQNCTNSSGYCNVLMSQSHDATNYIMRYDMSNLNLVWNVCFRVAIGTGEFAMKNLPDEKTTTNKLFGVKTIETVVGTIECGYAGDCSETSCAISLKQPKTFNVSAILTSELSASDGSLELVFESEVSGSMIAYVVTNLASDPRSVTWEGTPLVSVLVPGNGGTVGASVAGPHGVTAVRPLWIDGDELRGLASTHLPQTGSVVCFGDGGGAPCGCGNVSVTGTTSGCLNSVSVGGAGARLVAAGVASVAAPDLSLDCSGVRTQPGLLFQGNVALAGGNGVTFGDGIRCCGSGVVRLALFNPPSGPEPVSVTHHLDAAPLGVSPGDERCYQYWYRDPGGPCGTGFNLSNAASVLWGP